MRASIGVVTSGHVTKLTIRQSMLPANFTALDYTYRVSIFEN